MSSINTPLCFSHIISIDHLFCFAKYGNIQLYSKSTFRRCQYSPKFSANKFSIIKNKILCCRYEFIPTKVDLVETNSEWYPILSLFLCINTNFDTICVHPIKSAYSCVKMRTVKLVDKLEFVSPSN